MFVCETKGMHWREGLLGYHGGWLGRGLGGGRERGEGYRAARGIVGRGLERLSLGVGGGVGVVLRGGGGGGCREGSGYGG